MSIEASLLTSGERLKRARILAGITTRRQFEEKHHISANTLQGWEQCKNPLSPKGARRIVAALKEEGLLCSAEWLLEGKGIPPRSYETLNAGLSDVAQLNSALTQHNIEEEQLIYQEIQLFKQHNPHAIVMNVTDDAMEPYYSVGDYIGGLRVCNNDISRYTNSLCIIELENNLIIPRFLQKNHSEGRYNISTTNPKTSASPLNYYNMKIVALAPVVWHRRKISALRAAT